MNDREKRKSFLSIFEELSKNQASDETRNGHPYPPEEEDEGYSLTDELDHEILMHRDAHFGGDFNVMLEYYQDDNIGVNPDFDIERVAYLMEVERQMGQDLSPLILSGAEAEAVARARRAYETLKEIYEVDEDEETSPFPRLLADLILTESEEPEEEIDAIVAQGTRIVPELLQIIKSDDAYSPLFPGYGFAPYLAILCLGRIKDPTSIVPLFEILGRDILFEEDVILDALKGIGEPAKQFLLDVVQGRPITKDTVNAAFALTMFANQSDVAIRCFEQLQDAEVQNKPLLRSYLLYNCEGLRGTPYQELLIKMAKNPELASDFRQEIEMMIREWR